MFNTTQTRRAGPLLCLVLLLSYASGALAVGVPGGLLAWNEGAGTIRWQWSRVPGAVLYDVQVNGQHVELTAADHTYSRNFPSGVHSFNVQAVDGNGNRSPRSGTYRFDLKQGSNNGGSNNNAASNQQAAVVTNRSSGGSVSAPGGVKGTEVGQGTVRWNWNGVSGANRYQVTVDGRVVGEVNGTEFTSNNLWAGDHSMTVRAIDSSGSLSPMSATAKIQVRSRYDAGRLNESWQVGQAQPASNNNPSPAAPQPQQNNNPQPSTERSLIDPATWSQPGLRSGDRYELVFSDEFNGSTLNGFRWNTQLRWDGEWNGERYEYRRINNENQFYVNTLGPDRRHREQVVPVHNPFEFDGSRLAIRAVKNPLQTNNNNNNYGDFYSMLHQQEFLSGALTTYNKFSQKYGYFEARIRIPNHTGAFPAFWLYYQRERWQDTRRTEIDIMENLGHAPWYVYTSFHYYNNVSPSYGGDPVSLKPQPEGQIYTGTDYSQDYHTYAVEWEPNKVTWYIDGNKVSELWSSYVDHEELYLILNLAMGGSWTNYPASSGGLGRSWDQFFPNQNDLNNFGNPALEIDYVRVYRRR